MKQKKSVLISWHVLQFCLAVEYSELKWDQIIWKKVLKFSKMTVDSRRMSDADRAGFVARSPEGHAARWFLKEEEKQFDVILHL